MLSNTNEVETERGNVMLLENILIPIIQKFSIIDTIILEMYQKEELLSTENELRERIKLINGRTFK